MTRPIVDVLLNEDDLHDALRADVLAGLTAPPGHRTLPPKWFYDERGSQLFDEITRLPEYYPTRRERAILSARAGEIMAIAGPSTLIELGSGTSDKTRLLLDAGAADGRLRRFVPFDVSEETLRSAASALAAAYPDLAVHAVVGDFDRHLGALGEVGSGSAGRTGPAGSARRAGPAGAAGPRLVAFLGGTIGNFEPPARARFLAAMACALDSGDRLLLGTDLVKDVGRLVAAYDDAAGVTADFNRNVLAVIGRELSADFDPSAFAHVARWNAAEEWIEMRLRAMGEQVVTVSDLPLKVTFADGEELLTEISAKFRREGVEAELAAAGFSLEQWWTDPAGDFGLSLARVE
jgi:L-histidine N-alpha-methyltransferase